MHPSTAVMDSGYGNTYSVAVPAIATALKTIWTVVQTDSQSFTTGSASVVTGITAPLNTTTWVTVSYPTLFYFELFYFFFDIGYKA